MRYRAFYLLLIGCLANAALAEQPPDERPLQRWGKIFSWTDKGVQHPSDGVMFELLHEVTKQLPEYQHRYQAMSLSRGFADLMHHDDLCMVGMMRNPERDQVGYFVGLWPVLPPQLLIRRKDRQAIVGQHASISLKEILNRPDLRGAALEGRYFGPALEPLVQAAKAKGQLQSVQSSASSNNLLNMLDAGRIDFSLDYLETFLTSSSRQPELRKKLVLIPLEEAQVPGIGGIYCSRTPRGKALIERIDQLAREPKLQVRFQAILNRNLPAEPREPYRPWIENYFKQRTQQSVTNLPASTAQD